MESRFNKYKDEGQTLSTHIANINSFIDWLFKDGNNLIEEEIQDLTRRINGGNAPAIFGKKKRELIKLGEDIEQLYETYHFNKDSKDN
jgi:hypothetical protein